jgi:hypothetical protein
MAAADAVVQTCISCMTLGMRVCASAVCVRVVVTVYVRPGAVRAHLWRGGDLRYRIDQPMPRVAAARAWLRFCATGRARARLAAGVNWTSRTILAPWGNPGGRSDHTSVIDAAGAIYVIGGVGGGVGGLLQDVWASTDGGVRPDHRGTLGGHKRLVWG